MKLQTQPLLVDNFRDFGEVIEHRGGARRHPFSVDGDQGTRHAHWVTKIPAAISFPFDIDQLEHHPHSDQAFFPLSGQRMLIVVCPSRPDGRPDVSKAAAFVSRPGQGILYRRNVWHAGMSVLDLPAEFVVTMAMASDGGDDVFLPLDNPLSIHLAEDL